MYRSDTQSVAENIELELRILEPEVAYLESKLSVIKTRILALKAALLFEKRGIEEGVCVQVVGDKARIYQVLAVEFNRLPMQDNTLDTEVAYLRERLEGGRLGDMITAHSLGMIIKVDCDEDIDL
jgi:hypothetical protein